MFSGSSTGMLEPLLGVFDLDRHVVEPLLGDMLRELDRSMLGGLRFAHARRQLLGVLARCAVEPRTGLGDMVRELDRIMLGGVGAGGMLDGEWGHARWKLRFKGL